MNSRSNGLDRSRSSLDNDLAELQFHNFYYVFITYVRYVMLFNALDSAFEIMRCTMTFMC